MTTTTRPAYYILEHSRRVIFPGVEPLWVRGPALTCPTEEDARAKEDAIRARFANDNAEHRFAVRRVGGAQ
jgi:hypothetical protein